MLNRYWLLFSRDEFNYNYSEALSKNTPTFQHLLPFQYNCTIVFILIHVPLEARVPVYVWEYRLNVIHCCLLVLYAFFSSLPVSGARGCGSWLGRRASLGCVENRWPLVPRSTMGRSKIKAQRAQPQESEVKRQGLSERAAGWSGPLGIAEDCVSVCVYVMCWCVCVGRGKGGCGLDLGLCLTWYALGLQRNTERDKREEKDQNSH